MAGTYRFASHVKAVGIVEIVFQVLYCILVFVVVAILILGVGLIASATERNYYNYPSDTYMTGYMSSNKGDGVSGIFIAIVVILVLVGVFEGWLVYLVFTGGQKKHATRLTIWYIIQSVFTAIKILLIIIYVALVGPGWGIIFDILYLVYRVYSIHVVRCHAEEINEQKNTPFSPPQILYY